MYAAAHFSARSSTSSLLSEIHEKSFNKLECEVTETGSFPKDPSAYQMQHAPRFSNHEMEERFEKGMRFLAGSKPASGQRFDKFDSGPPRFFSMMGSKKSLLLEPEGTFARLVMGSMNCKGMNRLVEPCAGSGVISQWANAMGMLPQKSVLNELDGYRHTTLEKTLTEPEAVKAALEKHGLEVRKIMYRFKHNMEKHEEVDVDVMTEWEDLQVPFHTDDRNAISDEVQDYLLNQAREFWDSVGHQPVPCADSAAIYKLLQMHMMRGMPVDIEERPVPRLRESSRRARLQTHQSNKAFELTIPNKNFYIQTLGESHQLRSGKGENYTRKSIERMSSDCTTIAADMPKIDVSRKDAYEVIQKTVSGDVVVFDPVYTTDENNKLRQAANSGSRYMSGAFPEYDVENWPSLSKIMEERWINANVIFTWTNRYTNRLRVLMEYHGWVATDAIKAGPNMKEIIFTNYELHDGAPRLRNVGQSSEVTRIAYAHDGIRLSAECKLKRGDESVILDAAIVHGALYAEVDGKIQRFILQNKKDEEGPWILSANQRDIPKPASPYRPESPTIASQGARAMQRNLMGKLPRIDPDAMEL